MCILSFVGGKFVSTKNISGGVHKKIVILIPLGKESLASGEGWEGDLLFTVYSIQCQKEINYFYRGKNTGTEAKTVIMCYSSRKP